MNSMTPHWSTARKLSFRYLFIFFSLFVFPFPVNVIPGLNAFYSEYQKFWTILINWVGKHLLGLEQELTLQFTGSGDKLFDWVLYFTVLLLTILGGTLWSILDRKRPNYERLQKWFLLFLTYYLAYYLFVYGIIKIFYLQFIPPNLERLLQTFGHASPMRLLWTFMGYSESYTVFAGVCETTAGILLLFRNTRTLGGLVAFGVMLNVFLLNVSYDVPVKLFSFQLMTMGLYIALVDYQRLLNLFVLNRPTASYPIEPIFQSRTGRYILIGIQVSLIGFIVITQILNAKAGRERYGARRAKAALYGVYEVSTFVKNQDTIPPLLTDSTRWKYVLFDYPHFTSIIMANDRLQRYNYKIDTTDQTFVFWVGEDSLNTSHLQYTQAEKDLRISGVLQGDTLSADLQYYPLGNFSLLNRGFHWVNEVPYNRYKDGR